MALNSRRGDALRQSLFWLVLVGTFVAAIWPQPIPLPGNPSDKVMHILAFLVLAGLAAFAFPRVLETRLLAALSAYGALIEATQAIPALNRQTEFLDWVADTCAAALVLAILSLIRRKWRE